MGEDRKVVKTSARLPLMQNYSNSTLNATSSRRRHLVQPARNLRCACDGHVVGWKCSIGERDLSDSMKNDTVYVTGRLDRVRAVRVVCRSGRCKRARPEASEGAIILSTKARVQICLSVLVSHFLRSRIESFSSRGLSFGRSRCDGHFS